MEPTSIQANTLAKAVYEKLAAEILSREVPLEEEVVGVGHDGRHALFG